MSNLVPYFPSSSPLPVGRQAKRSRDLQRRSEEITDATFIANLEIRSNQIVEEARRSAVIQMESRLAEEVLRLGDHIEQAAARTGSLGNHLLAEMVPGMRSRIESTAQAGHRRLLG